MIFFHRSKTFYLYLLMPLIMNEKILNRFIDKYLMCSVPKHIENFYDHILLFLKHFDICFIDLTACLCSIFSSNACEEIL